MANRKSWTIIAAILLSLCGGRLIAAENSISSPADDPVSSAATLSSPVPAATVPQKIELTVVPALSTEAKPGRVEEIKPVLFYLPDKDGKLQAVFDFGYEDFVELYKLKKQLERKEQRPRYTLDKLLVAGKAEDNRAELSIRLQITQHDSDWVRIPLRFDQGLLLDPAGYKGGGKMISKYVGAGEGYVAWLHGEAGASHEITMRISATIANAGADRKFKLFLPRASISEFKLAVAENSVTVQASEGATVLPPTALPSGGSEIGLRGANGDFELAWRKADAAEATSTAALEAVGSILARFDDRGLSTEAALTLRSYGAPFDRVLVRLPEGAELTPATSTAYSIAPIAGDDQSGGSRRQVEVRFPKKILGPVEVLLSCRRQFETKNPPSWQELAGFEVLGATRQWGVLAAATSGDWQVLWGDSNGVQQIDQLPEKLRVTGLAAGFEYFTQPFSIQARLNPRRTRINVEPEHLLFVDRDRLRLDSKLTYTIHGAKAHSLKIFMPDWQLDRIEPESLVSAEGVDLDENGMLTIPLLEPASGSIELRLKAVQTLPPDTTSIGVGMPQPLGTALVSAVLAVSPADNVELTPNSTTSVGLIRQQTALPLKLPERRQEPLFYRSEGKTVMFAADLKTHARHISCEIVDRVRIDERSLQVEQMLDFRIEFEAIDHLLIDVPDSLAKNPSLAFEREGKPLVVKAIARDDANAAASGMVRMHVALSEACLGECAVTARFSRSMPALQAVKPVVETIPLAVPADGEVLGNRLHVAYSPGVKASPTKKVWQTVEKEPLAAVQPGSQIFKTDGRVDRVVLDIGKEETSGVNATVVDRVWIQTWLAPSARQDRVAYQLLTNQSELNLKMPAGAAIQDMVAVLDGKQIDFRSLGNQRLSIPLSSDGEMRRYRLEIIYYFTETESLPSRLDLAFPQIGSGAWNRRIYWQLILPQNRHILADPKGFASEYRWEFSGFFWGRLPQMSQEELETWAGASHRPAPPQGMNVYLFSSLGNIDGATVRTAARLWLVLGSSGIALLVGLLLIYFPALRHPASLLTFALALLSLGLIYPEPTILLAQTSCLGLVLALLAGLFARHFPERHKRAVESPLAKPEIPSAKSPNLVPVSVVSVATTENRPTLLE